MKKLAKVTSMLLAIVLFVSIFATIPVSAASYPLIFCNSYGATFIEGTTGVLEFTIFRKYNNEKYYVDIYDEDGDKVGSTSGSVYGSNTIVDLDITVNTASLELEPGKYTIKYYMAFYTYFEWHTTPNVYTSYFYVIEDICNGNHNYGAAQTVTEPTCEKVGKAKQTCQTCSYVTYTEIPKAHNWDSGEITTQPTCTVAGVKTYTCETCDLTRTESVAAKGHSWNSGSVITQPTCTESGVKTYTCTACGETKNQTVARNGHSYTDSADQYCDVCGWKKQPTTLKKVDGVWKYYVDGMFTTSTTLFKFSGSWYYVKNGVVDFDYKGLVKFNGSWYYVKDGKVASNTTTLVKYNGEWFYVVNGKVASNTTTLVKYNGEWFYVVKGKIASKTTTLIKYNGGWYYIYKGKVASQTTTLVKYSGSWYYVKNGKVDFTYSGNVTYAGKVYTVRNGKVV